MQMISRQIISVVSTCCVVFGLCCCSGEVDSGAATEKSASNVDPTRASARALFDHIRTICSPEYPDAEAYYALVKWETPKQEIWRHHIENIDLPQYRFGKACQDRFGELPLMRSRSVWEIASFDWQKDEPDRAVIESVNDYGVKSPLHLVRIGDQWWISGYTFEYSNIGFDHPSFEKVALSLPGIGPYIDGVTARIRNGEFRTLEEAEKDQQAAVSQYSKEHPQASP